MTNTNTLENIEWVIAIDQYVFPHQIGRYWAETQCTSQPLLFSTLAEAHAETLAITEEDMSDYYGGRLPAGFYDYAADVWETQWVFEEYDPDIHDYAAIDACGHNFTTKD